MSRTLLLEIGTEEMPARFVAGACEQLKEKVEKWLSTNRISYGEVQSFGTPRRFAVMIKDVNEQQDDINEELRGPAKKIAVDEKGDWTKAALGFARGKGLAPDDLYLQEVGGIEYVFARKHQAGQSTMDLLPQLKDIVAGLSFPKNMRWGAYELRFVRPIRWIVALFGEDVIRIQITDVESGKETQGHRFLGQPTRVEKPEDYVSTLAAQYVLVDPEERKSRILAQIKKLETEKGWTVPIDEGLLDEVIHLVEYPTVLFGSFEEEYLEIPQEVLVTSMREHQRYFPVQNDKGELLPHFITVRNGDDRDLATVARGNEKVLRARLSDARFFYQEDQKMKIEDALARLENVVFHEELGTIGDKIRRVQEAAAIIGDAAKLSAAEKEKLQRAATINKFDLVSQMVYEFPELQGIMGERYARLAGEDETVAHVIFEHYLPRFAGDRLPETNEGAVLSIADKLDTIVGCFAIGIIPTGSQDPYALRRQATGIVQIMLDKQLPISLDELFEGTLSILESKSLLKRDKGEILQDLCEFFALRLKNLLQEQHVRYDIIDAVLTADATHVTDVIARAQTLMDATEKEEFKSVVESFNRVNNLAQKATSSKVDIELFETEAERNLWTAFTAVKQEGEALLEAKEFGKALARMAELKSDIDAFFDNVMVMVEDEKVKANRLALLVSIAVFIFGLADFSKIVFA
ncbi:glycine--tRNA ligase subunit beta [Aneurinibacillus aneurinilyticus]|uniref:Glycine--tRNA ligase beta subunit n=1 Tax=Aneurinibacillus aneurinilyticus ATCC 12856 TaxID=649747 RepID=U1X5U3_ANEAE|nr:glycine--tRNA ligase subunit beta [Aneurinibacillus aneurinilyticus]ERI09908.1 glycine--tRNA ligase, beta subunit [Aneurinibacillus aneurinilyticus ATCC 12856]MED0706747.1 glycine--tRNA ligase subunit beta [Aneurinibacillus aneurinilyticus]MED0725710.1 glycine--tRNA ligase subunit beta [Aneurinibacillus aneurinilyticus]MED0734637.1 glycine--tRNA ligase subunit beta [Aneurinibacillus aneurinilyticus]MED0739077.1 glycine--tRNA ligase subunit beta [Aneurinibacillus aneurinilyticus]